MKQLQQYALLRNVDMKWIDHIDDMDNLRTGIGLRGYGNKNPITVYQAEGFDMFDNMIVNVLKDMAYDTPRMMGKFHIEDKGVIKIILGIVGRIICNIKVGTLARILFIKCDKSIKKITLLDYAAELVRCIFEGNQYYKEGTAKGDLLLAFLKRIGFVLKKIELKDKKGDKLDLYDVLKNTAGNYDTDDYNATLILK